MDKAFTYKTKIYYEDTDAGGIVYYANYLKYFERARTEMIYSLGYDHKKLNQSDVYIVVRSCHTDYEKPVKWKKHFNLIGSSKDASRTKAIELFPRFSNDMAKKKDANKADAILIERYFLNHINNEGFHG